MSFPVAGDAPEPALPPAMPAPATRGWGEWLSAAAALAWLAGALVVAARQLRAAWRVQCLAAQARPAPTGLGALVRELAAGLGVRPPRVVTLPGLAGPLVWGLGRPRLLWPEGLEGRLPEAGLRAVLVHELAHLRRRDHWVGWALLAGACVWWWHPLFRLVRRRLGREAELACDAWVVATLPQARRAYAEALLEVCANRPWAAAAPALGAAGVARDLERRLLMVMRGEAPCRLSRRGALAVVVLALLALPAWTLGQQAKPPAKPDQAPPAEKKPAEANKGAIWVDNNDGVLDVYFVDPNRPFPAGGGAAESDRKLRQVEEKLLALLREVQALRGAARPLMQAYPVRDLAKYYVNEVAPAAKPARPTPPPGEIHLTRTTYALPAAKAEALAKFLQQHVQAPVLETKAEGDSLTVTTTPEVQRAIGGFVALVRGQPAAAAKPANPYQPLTTPQVRFLNQLIQTERTAVPYPKPK